MGELQLRRMQSDAIDQWLLRFGLVVLAVADDRVPNGRELHTNLILQPRNECDPHQRSLAERAFDGILEFGTRCFAVLFRAQLLMHPFFPKIVDQGSFFRIEMSANYCQIVPDGSVREKLSDQCVPIACSLGEQQNSGSKAIDAMYDQRALPARLQVLR